MEISFNDFQKVVIKVGTVLEVKKNEKARKPSLIVKVDFGNEIGVKQSSAQITHYYNAENLIGKQVIGVCNFPKKNIAGFISEVLILGAIEKDGKVVLVHPSQKTETENDIGTSGDTGDNKTRKEISARQLLGGDTQGSLDKAK